MPTATNNSRTRASGSTATLALLMGSGFFILVASLVRRPRPFTTGASPAPLMRSPTYPSRLWQARPPRGMFGWLPRVRGEVCHAPPDPIPSCLRPIGRCRSCAGSDGEPYVVRATATPCLNVRDDHDTGVDPIDCIPPGTPVDVLRAVPYWREVRLADGRTGWAAKKYLSRRRLRQLSPHHHSAYASTPPIMRQWESQYGRRSASTSRVLAPDSPETGGWVGKASEQAAKGARPGARRVRIPGRRGPPRPPQLRGRGARRQPWRRQAPP